MSKQAFIGKGIKELVKNSPNKNVINILRSIIEDEDCTCYIPLSYSAEKKTTTDPKIHFNPIEAGKAIVATSIQSNKERFNFSINGEVDVYVENEDENNGVISLIPKKIFRTYTVIRDGKLTIDYIIARLSEETFYDLRRAGILYYNGAKVADNHVYAPNFLYKIVLTDMPLISYAWAQPQQIGLYENLDEENKLANTLKEVKAIIKRFTDAGVALPVFPEDSIYYNEKYFGEDRVGEKVLCECITYEVKNENEVIDEYIERASLNILEASKVKKEINRKLREIRFINRCIEMAIENSSTKGNFEWSEPKTSGRTIIKTTQICNVAGIGRMYELKRVSYSKEF